MKTSLLLAISMALVVGCSSDDGGQGSGGTSGASGGASGASGAAGASGTASGGTGGSGGVSSGGSGGTGGNAGSSGAGGSTGGSAGSAGGGGSGGVGGSAGSATGGSSGAGAGGAAGAGTGGNAGGGMSDGGRVDAADASDARDAGGGGGGSMDGGLSDAAADASGGFEPCQSNPCKILPLGDSITFGVGDEGNGGYRGPLFAAAVAAGQKITFTGSLSNGPAMVSGQTFPKRNEGHSGWGIARVTPYSGTSAGIATVIPNPAFSTNSGGTPEIILLHIGTNDASSFTAAQMISDLKAYLDKLITNAPNALVVVAQIIPLGYGTNDVIKTYNQAIPGMVQERAAAGKHIVLVDMSTGFAAGTMLGSDNIHPNSSGYKFMADHWYARIGSLLPK